jgi:hypothetical protein
MPRLLHLNGPSLVGKSTLARRYAAEHPGTLNLDLDVLVGLVGGWQDDFASALAVARGHGTAIAVRHLEAGHDVVLPQLITSFDGHPWADDVAAQAGAEYVEVALLADSDEHERRLLAKRPEHAVEAYTQQTLSEPDGELFGRIRLHLETYLAGRPATIRLDTSGLDADQAYLRLTAVLGEARG